ncbi:MAG: DUF167 domain-containing protein [Actinomycetota bacterium]
MVDDLYTVNDDGSIVLSVHAQPGAGRSAVVGRHGDAIKVKVAAPPEHGRANDALCAMIAQHLGLRAAQVEVVSGASSRAKKVQITGVEEQDITAALERILAPTSRGNASSQGSVRDRRATRGR